MEAVSNAERAPDTSFDAPPGTGQTDIEMRAHAGTGVVYLGPSHVMRLTHAIDTLQLPRRSDARFVGGGGLPLWAPAIDAALAEPGRHAKIIVADFRFGNKIFRKTRKIESYPDLRGFAGIAKPRITPENDQILYDFVKSRIDRIAGSAEKSDLFFWDLFIREYRNRKAGHYGTGNDYRHPIWNLSDIMDRYSDLTVDLRQIVEDDVAASLAIDNSCHPSLKGWAFILNGLEGKSAAELKDIVEAMDKNLPQGIFAPIPETILIGNSSFIKKIQEYLDNKLISLPPNVRLRPDMPAEEALKTGALVVDVPTIAVRTGDKESGYRRRLRLMGEAARALGQNPNYRIVLWSSWAKELIAKRETIYQNYVPASEDLRYAVVERKFGRAIVPLASLNPRVADGMVQLNKGLEPTQFGIMALFALITTGRVSAHDIDRYQKAIAPYFPSPFAPQTITEAELGTSAPTIVPSAVKPPPVRPANLDVPSWSMASASAKALSVQRGSILLLRIASLITIPPDGHLILRLTHADGRCTEVPAMSNAAPWPGDPLNQLGTLLSQKSAKGLRMRRYRADFSVDTADLPPIRDVSPIFRWKDTAEIVPWLNQQVCLSHRIPQNAQEFRSHLSFRKGRHKDPETVMWACRDIITTHLNVHTQPQEMNAYLCNCFVIFIYKAIEVESDVQEDFIVRHTEKILALTSDIRESSGVRENIYHAGISVRTALWHFWVFRRNRDRVHEIVKAIVADHRAFTGPLRVTYAYNLCLSMEVYAIFEHNFRNKPECIKTLQEIYTIYRLSVALNTQRVQYFRELGISHTTTLYALEVLEQISEGKTIDSSLLDQIAEHCARVKTPSFISNLRSMLSCPVAEGA